MFSSIATDLFQKSISYPERPITASAHFALSQLAKSPLSFAMAVAQLPHWSFDFIPQAERTKRVSITESMIKTFPCPPDVLLYAQRLLNIFINPQTSTLSEFGLEFLSQILESLEPSTLLTKERLSHVALKHGFSYEHVEAVFFGIFQMRNASKYTIQSAFLSTHRPCDLQAWERLCKIAKADGIAATVRLLNASPEHKSLLWVDGKRMQGIEKACLQASPEDLGPTLFQSLPDSLVAQWIRTHADVLNSATSKASVFQAAAAIGALCTLEEISPSLSAPSYAAITRFNIDFSIRSSTLIETEILLQHCNPFGVLPEMSAWVDFISRKDLKAEPAYVGQVTLAALRAKKPDTSLFLDREGWVSLSSKTRFECPSPLKMMSTILDSQDQGEASPSGPVMTDFSATVLGCYPSPLYFSKSNPSVDTPYSIVNAWSPHQGRTLAFVSGTQSPISSLEVERPS